MADTPQMPALPEPVAHLVTGGMTFVDAAFCSHEQARTSVARRDDGASLKPLYTAAQMHAFRAEGVREALAGYAELLQAATNYVNRYALDEADDGGQYWTGCSEQQHKDARRLLDATRALAAEIQPPQKADTD